MSQVVITARIDTETAAQLDRIGALFDRKRAWLIAQAVKRYAKEGADYVDGIQEAIDSLDRGEGIQHEEIAAEFLPPREARRSAA